MQRGIIKLTPYNVEMGLFSFVVMDPSLGIGGGPILPPYPDHGLPPYPDNTLPGRPPYPSQGPGFPTHPIVIPPPQPPQPGVPAHPIVLPPDNPATGLPPGSGVIIPLPPAATPPTPPADTPADHAPYIVWFGPGTVAAVIWMPPVATPR